MRLLSYLRENEISDADFAATVGRSQSAVRKWMYDQRVPRPQEMQKIAEATNGAVTANDFMPAPAPQSKEGAAA